jgi:Tol biopolymer transport system component/DNA-binding winged helix-turn-helix (wHTH) protein
LVTSRLASSGAIFDAGQASPLIAPETFLLYNEHGKKAFLLNPIFAVLTTRQTVLTIGEKVFAKSLQSFDKILTEAMSKQIKHFYEFGEFRLDLNERILLRQNKVVALTPKAFETLLVLVQHSGHIVEKDFLMNKIWPDTFVEEVSLARNISALRKALGESNGSIQYIETFPKRGYRFVIAVSEHIEDDTKQNVSHNLIIHPSIEEVPATSSLNENGQTFDAKTGLTAQSNGVAEGVAPSESPIAHFAVADSHNALAQKVDAPVFDKATESTLGKRNFPGFISRYKIAILIALVVLVVGVVVIVYLLKFDKPAGSTFQEMKITPLTSSGKATQGAVSPDGKYIAYVASDSEQYSIWVKHIATNSEVQIVPPARNPYWGLTFSPDGSYIYYGGFQQALGVLYQSPIFGGTSKKVIEDIMPPISFSPDGNRFAFVRSNEKESSLVIANIDGSGEQTLVRRTKPDSFASAPAWSPLGKVIACVANNASSELHSTIVEVRLEDGTEKEIIAQRWNAIDSLNWLADGKNLVMAAQAQRYSPTQIWLISYASGEVRRITNDLTDYRGVSLSADSHNLVTRQVAHFMNIWVAPDGDINKVKQITYGLNYYGKFSWTPDGKIVVANSSGSHDICIMDTNGVIKKNLTNDYHNNDFPAVSPDGRYIVFVSDRTGSYNIWRMNSDGSNAKALTDGSYSAFPHISLDGQSVLYYQHSPTRGICWKVPIDGGDPVQLNYKVPHMLDASLDISPDGKQVAAFYREPLPTPHWRLAILPIEGGEPFKTFEVQQPLAGVKSIRWLPDGRTVAYINSPDGVSNIWVQSIDGGQPKQLTNFNSEQILYFAWSPDGKQFACVRGHINRDIVSISNFK